MATVSTPTQDSGTGSDPSNIKSDDSSPRQDGGRGSPPPNCAICLGTCKNKSFTDSCFHQFCFKCLLTWSKVKAECPLCKQNFKSIIHNVKSNHQYEEYRVEQRQTEEIPDRIDIDSLVTSQRRFRYRTTLTLPRRDSIAIQQLLMHHNILMDVYAGNAGAASAGAGAGSALRRRSPASFRRTVYRYNLWARPLPDFTGRFRDCSPEFYRYNVSQVHRLVPWLNRELHYLLNENIGHISYVISRILDLLPQYHINSPEFRETVQRYFGDRTEHFLHELYCFASTPYDMAGYDRNVQYTTDTRISTMINEVISSSESEASVDSDIVMISSSEPAAPTAGPSRPARPARAPAPVYPHHYIPQPAADNVIPIETISQSDTDDDSSEVMVVGYIKPPQDRTPEVVDLLGSDSDVIVQDPAPPEPGPSAEAQDGRAGSLVKLTLARPRAAETDSEDSAYTPSPSPPRRRRRRRSDDTATASDSCRSTPSVASELVFGSSTSGSVYQSPTSPSTCPYEDTSSDSWSSSEDNVKRKKSRRKVSSTERKKRRTKKKSKVHKKSKKNSKSSPSKEKKQSKRKSNSGKGVKSSKRSGEASVAQPSPEPPPAAPEQPGTSGASSGRKRKLDSGSTRKSSRDNKRLKSVVNVINSHKKISESSSSSKSNSNSLPNDSKSNENAGDEENRNKEADKQPESLAKQLSNSSDRMRTAAADDSDSDDDLPLNLTIARAFSSLL